MLQPGPGLLKRRHINRIKIAVSENGRHIIWLVTAGCVYTAFVNFDAHFNRGKILSSLRSVFHIGPNPEKWDQIVVETKKCAYYCTVLSREQYVCYIGVWLVTSLN